MAIGFDLMLVSYSTLREFSAHLDLISQSRLQCLIDKDKTLLFSVTNFVLTYHDPRKDLGYSHLGRKKSYSFFLFALANRSVFLLLL